MREEMYLPVHVYTCVAEKINSLHPHFSSPTSPSSPSAGPAGWWPGLRAGASFAVCVQPGGAAALGWPGTDWHRKGLLVSARLPSHVSSRRQRLADRMWLVLQLEKAGQQGNRQSQTSAACSTRPNEASDGRSGDLSPTDLECCHLLLEALLMAQHN